MARGSDSWRSTLLAICFLPKILLTIFAAVEEKETIFTSVISCLVIFVFLLFCFSLQTSRLKFMLFIQYSGYTKCFFKYNDWGRMPQFSVERNQESKLWILCLTKKAPRGISALVAMRSFIPNGVRNGGQWYLILNFNLHWYFTVASFKKNYISFVSYLVLATHALILFSIKTQVLYRRLVWINVGLTMS